ncbi:HpcH/HpaI aldolase/citrate lyase family protein [Zavarzinia sp. CC-PAN008]|uniref:HpcH/HpaI aldolase/citrate lyase family protein n=1 Tax=Zavarzinia sp. CC-PAN008 TaxID=3243332 RepID=UPI003F7437A7
MIRKDRPRRSVLYMPGFNARAMDKARTLPADAVILDLEDAVSPDSKDVARKQVAEALAQGGYGHRELIVRINALDTPWGIADLEMAAKSGCDAILVPKVESAAQLQDVETRLEALGAPEFPCLWAMMETPRAILAAAEIAAATPRLTCFVMGTSDLTKDLHARHTPMRLPMLVALGTCILAARAEGLTVLDGVYLGLDDAEGFRATCVQGLEMGFDGKTLIHPSQVAPCNEVFAPSEAEVTSARRIIEGFAEAQKEGKAVVVVDGKLVENLHVAAAQRTLALHDAIASRAG